MLDLPKEQVGNEYPEVLRVLLPPEILVSLEISAQFEMHSACSSKDFSSSLI